MDVDVDVLLMCAPRMVVIATFRPECGSSQGRRSQADVGAGSLADAVGDPCRQSVVRLEARRDAARPPDPAPARPDPENTTDRPSRNPKSYQAPELRTA